SIEYRPQFGMGQRVIDGHKETLEGGAESARRVLKAGGRLGLGGDYGLARTPPGSYAKELTLFFKLAGHSPPAPIRSVINTRRAGRGRGAKSPRNTRNTRKGRGREPGPISARR